MRNIRPTLSPLQKKIVQNRSDFYRQTHEKRNDYQ